MMNLTKLDRKNFWKDNFVVFIGQGIIKLRGVILLPIIVRLLGKENYGVWVQLITLQILIAQISSFNLEKPMALLIAQDQTSSNLRNVYWSILYIKILFAIFIISVTYIFSELIMNNIGLGGADKSLFLLSLCSVPFYCLFALNLNFYRSTLHMRLRSALEVAGSIGELIGSIGVLSICGSLRAVFTWILLWRGFLSAATTLHIASQIGIGFSDKYLQKYAIFYVLPLFPSTLSSWVLDRFDRFILGYYKGIEVVAEYNAIYSFMQILTLLSIPFQTTLLPWLAILCKNNQKEAFKLFFKSALTYIMIAVPLTVVLGQLSPYILKIMTHGKILTSSINSLMIGVGIVFWGLSAFQVMMMHALRKPLNILKISLVSAGLNISMNILLIPILGIKGAAVSTMVSYGVMCILYFRLTFSHFRQVIYYSF